MFAEAPTIIAALSAAAAVGTLLAYVYFGRRSSKSAALEEALALAETRADVITELRGELVSLEQRHARMNADYEGRVHEVQLLLEQARNEAREAQQMQRFYSATVIDLLEHLLVDLEQSPPNADDALKRIRELLFGNHRVA